jgi:hypothetical protein
MAVNPRKERFKELIMSNMRAVGGPVSKTSMIEQARSEEPDLFDDAEPCYPGCATEHPKWRHEFDRCIYDLTQTRPPKLWAEGRGVYRPFP